MAQMTNEEKPIMTNDSGQLGFHTKMPRWFPIAAFVAGDAGQGLAAPI